MGGFDQSGVKEISKIGTFVLEALVNSIDQLEATVHEGVVAYTH